MAERIVDQRGGVCDQCGEDYRSLSQHWSLSQTCDYRSLSDHQREIVRGLLLGDGTLEANELAYLRCAVPPSDESILCGSHASWAGSFAV